LGELLIMRGLLADEDVVSALAEQRRTKCLLGQILVDRGLISTAALDSTLAEQASGFKPERGFGAGLRDAVEEQRQQRVRAERQRRRPLGQVLVRQGHVTDEEINRALAEQAKSGKLIGEILLDQGVLSPPELSRALEEQAEAEVEKGFGTGLRDALARGGST
jgi:type IV pilus assembly protein PilB